MSARYLLPPPPPQTQTHVAFAIPAQLVRWRLGGCSSKQQGLHVRVFLWHVRVFLWSEGGKQAPCGGGVGAASRRPTASCVQLCQGLLASGFALAASESVVLGSWLGGAWFVMETEKARGGMRHVYYDGFWDRGRKSGQVCVCVCVCVSLSCLSVFPCPTPSSPQFPGLRDTEYGAPQCGVGEGRRGRLRTHTPAGLPPGMACPGDGSSSGSPRPRRPCALWRVTWQPCVRVRQAMIKFADDSIFEGASALPLVPCSASRVLPLALPLLCLAFALRPPRLHHWRLTRVALRRLASMAAGTSRHR